MLLRSFVFAWVHSGAPRGRRVQSSSRWFTRARLPVVGFFQVRVGSLGRVMLLFAFACVILVIGFAWGHWGGPSGRSGSRVFTLARLGVVAFIRVRVCSMGRT